MGEVVAWKSLGSQAEVFERWMVPAIFGPWSAPHLERAAVRPGERVLDLACGTGILARRTIERVGPLGRVVGLDLSAGMLATAQLAPDAQGVHWCQGNGLRVPFVDGRFDVVLCQQGLQFFKPALTGLNEMRRLLRPGGRTVVSVWTDIDASPGYAGLAAALARFAAPQPAPFAPFSLGDKDELRRLLHAAGFHDLDVTSAEIAVRFPSAEDFVAIVASGSTSLSTTLEAIPVADRAGFLEIVTGYLAPYASGGEVEFPLRGNIASGRR